MQRKSKADRLLDERIGQAWSRVAHGVQVSIMDIPAIFSQVRAAVMLGCDLDQACREVGAGYVVGVSLDAEPWAQEAARRRGVAA